MLELDHLLWEEFRLDEGEKRFAELTGIMPAFGGTHPDAGTHNSLLSLGHGKYLEIIAPDPTHLNWAHLPKEAPANFRPGLFAFAVRTYDLVLVEGLIERAGLNVGSRHNVSRQLPNGEVLKWESILVGGHTFGNFIPFFTYCGDMIHPSETSPKGCELLEFSVGHPESRELSRLYKVLQVNVPVFHSESPQLRAVLSTPKGSVTLRSR